MSLDAMKQALEALEAGDWYIGQLEPCVYSADDTGTHEERAKVQAAITALRAAIEQAQEPVAFDHGIGIDRFKVVRGAFWWHVLVGDSSTEHGKFRSRAGAEKMAADLLREFRNGAFVQHTAPRQWQAQEPVAWVYPEALAAFEKGDPWVAYGSNGDGPYSDGVKRIPLYLNDAVARRVEPRSRGSGAGFESLPASPNQPEQGQDKHEDWCASLTQLLMSMPPKPAPCNCKLKTARRDSRQWQGLTAEEIHEIVGKKWWDWEDAFDIEGFSRAIEARLREKNS